MTPEGNKPGARQKEMGQIRAVSPRRTTMRNIPDFLQGNYVTKLCEMFSIEKEELNERAQRGTKSTLFKRWIQGKATDAAPSEKELHRREEKVLKKVGDPVFSASGEAAYRVFTAIAGSYLLDNQVPPCIR